MSVGTTGNSDEVIQTGDIVVWYKAHAAAPAFPADSAWGAAIVGYTDPGYTDGGVGMNVGTQYGEMRVDQKKDPLARPFQSRTLEISFALAQISPANLAVATGMGATATVAPTGPTTPTRGHNSWQVGDDAGTTERTYLLDILQPSDEAARIFVPKGQSTGSVNPTINRGQKGILATQITALLDDSIDPPLALEYREILPALTA